MVRVLTAKEFISRAMILHKNKYEYYSTYYINMRTKICIVCPLHGEFFQLPRNHINRKQGCPTCNSRLKSREQFIQDAIRTHGSIYDYSRVVYVNNKTKVKIICLQHGEYMQRPTDHLQQKQGCPRCVKSGYSKISIQFLNDLA